MASESDKHIPISIAIDEINRLMSVGRRCNKERRWDDAEDAAREAFAIAHGAGATRFYTPGSFLSALGITYEGRGQTTIAEDLMLCAIEEDRKIGKRHDHLPQMWETNLAMFYIRQERFDEAEPIIQRYINTPGEKLGSSEYDRAFKETYLGRLREAQGRYDEAEQIFCQAIHLTEQGLGEDHPALGLPLQLYAGFLKGRGRHEEAKSLRERARIIKDNYLANYKPEPGKCPPIIYPED